MTRFINTIGDMVKSVSPTERAMGSSVLIFSRNQKRSVLFHKFYSSFSFQSLAFSLLKRLLFTLSDTVFDKAHSETFFTNTLNCIIIFNKLGPWNYFSKLRLQYFHKFLSRNTDRRNKPWLVSPHETLSSTLLWICLPSLASSPFQMVARSENSFLNVHGTVF